jgi:hypothetical protein
MLSVLDATTVVRQNHPYGDIKKVVTYKNLYLFMVFNNRPGEEEMDPYYSVNKDTGVFNEFSIFTDGDMDEVLSLFENVPSRKDV